MAKNVVIRKGKIFVLDTNILLHDPTSLFRFGNHDVVIPITVISELDSKKNRNDLIGANAREVIRRLDELSHKTIYDKGVSLGENKGKIRIYFLKELHPDVRRAFKDDIPDHRIISVALNLHTKRGQTKNVIFVSNDVNLRLKAGSLGLATESYQNDRVENVDELYKGKMELEHVDGIVDINKLYKDGEVEVEKLAQHIGRSPYPNETFILSNDRRSSVLARFDPNKNKLVLANSKKIYGRIEGRNTEQKLAISCILDPNISLITLIGKAGTGKTLVAIGVAISMMKDYNKILISRPAVELSGKDSGALPGNAREKVAPYMQSLYDNIAVLKNQNGGEHAKKSEILAEAIQSGKISIEPLAYIRGRTLPKVLFIVDEAQNLTPKEIKTIVTRMGEGSKIIFTGDIHQIDNPYLDTHSNGLTYLVDRAKDYERSAHITFEKGERSELADWGAEVL